MKSSGKIKVHQVQKNVGNTTTWAFQASDHVKKARYTKRCIPYNDCIKNTDQKQYAQGLEFFTEQIYSPRSESKQGQ